MIDHRSIAQGSDIRTVDNLSENAVYDFRYTLPEGYYSNAVKGFRVRAGNSVRVRPKYVPGYHPRWPVEKPAATDWEQVENHIGEQGYLNGEPHTIKQFGPYPEGWSAAPPEKNAAEQQAELINLFMVLIQNRLDSFARTRSYDDAKSCVSVYLGCDNDTFSKEAEYMQKSIVKTWEWVNAYTNAVLLGEKAMPESWEDFEAELDAAVPLEWPVPDTRVQLNRG